jgi:protein-L-isoaspartate(D-aspartate) O-methyltransferase
MSNKPSSQAKHMILGQLLTNEIIDKRILQAISDVPREAFVPKPLLGSAYVDEDLAMGGGRFLLEPLSFAQLLHLAEITPACRVLIIGGLCGYSAAVASKLAHHVVMVDIDEKSIEQARANFKYAGADNVDVQQVKSLADGYALSAPYNAIIIEGAVEFFPDAVTSQLAIDGRLAAIRNVSRRPGIAGGLGKAVLVKREGGKIQEREYFDASAALLPGFQKPAGFVF